MMSGVNWYDRVRCRWLDRLAARRMIAHVCGELSVFYNEPRAKTRDEMMIEAWLWRRYGEVAIADSMERMIRVYDKTGAWVWPIEP